MTVLTGDEHFTFHGVPINRLLCDFWTWQSDYMFHSPLRTVLAEFIVAAALDIDTASGHVRAGFLRYKDHLISLNCKPADVIVLCQYCGSLSGNEDFLQLDNWQFFVSAEPFSRRLICCDYENLRGAINTVIGGTKL